MLRAMSKRERIVVALSGGVDSATCAGLLVEAGHEVVGISMRLYNAKGTVSASGGRCCGPRDLEDARVVCAHLGIPFYVADYEEEFHRTVIDDFVATYQRGETPNPCVRCNEQVKFLPLLYRARALGATALATGHYARLEGEKGARRLLRGVDGRKDQSYFLFGMPRSALDFVEFPLGGMTKDEVRGHARRLGLPVSEKPESQEICFVPDGDYAGFVERQGGQSPPGGDVVDERGKVIGHHEGVHHFTIGQRRGLGFGVGSPQYVVGIDALSRRVKVGPKESLYAGRALVSQVRWLGEPPGDLLRCGVQIRYRRVPQSATVQLTGEQTAAVVFDSPELAVTPGQAAVFYDGDRVLGGGFISESAPAAVAPRVSDAEAALSP
jgi:tRNA-specific 2-thiouridylase